MRIWRKRIEGFSQCLDCIQDDEEGMIGTASNHQQHLGDQHRGGGKVWQLTASDNECGVKMVDWNEDDDGHLPATRQKCFTGDPTVTRIVVNAKIAE